MQFGSIEWYASVAGTIDVLYREELHRPSEIVGAATWLYHARENGRDGTWLREQLHNSAEGVEARKPHPPKPATLPGIRGLDFVDEAGQRTVLCGCDAFLAYRQFLDGVDLTPFFAESRELGFSLWRVFLMGSIAQNTVMDLRPSEPGYYDKLRPFADLLNANGITLLATVFVDAEDVMPQASERDRHWHAVADRLRGPATILSGGNQYSKNGWNPSELSDPGMMWSRGSDVSDRVTQPHGAPVQEFHPRRDLPASIMDAVASAVFIYQSGTDWKRPLIISEPRKYTEDGEGDTSNDPNLAWEFARLYSTECAGAVFHSWSGQRGQLLGPNQRACAAAFVRGMRL